MTIKLSIIIPMYNVEKYIEKCLRSCLNQNIPRTEYEIIVVNDGSPDKSLYIAKQIAQDYKNVAVFSQDNKGLSEARNFGFGQARGEYVWFVDSDDYIENNCLKNIIPALDGLDILQLQYRYVYEDSYRCVDAPIVSIPDTITGKEAIQKDLMHIPAQFSIYRRQYIIDNKLLFYPGIFHEYVDFKPRAFASAKRVRSLDIIVYNYLQRNGSITSKKGEKHISDLLVISNRLYAIAFDDINKDIKPQLCAIIACNINWEYFGTF